MTRLMDRLEGQVPAARRLVALGAAAVLSVGAIGYALSVDLRSGQPASQPIVAAPTTGAGPNPTAGTGTLDLRAPAPGSTGTPGTASGSPSTVRTLASQLEPVRAAPANSPPILLGPLDPSASVTFALSLKMPNGAAIDQYLEDLSDPSSPNYRHFLSAAQFGAKFGLPVERIDAVQTWAAANGFQVLDSYLQRTAIRLEAPAATLTAVFGVHLNAYMDPVSGAQFHAPADVEQVPSAISDAVVGLSGLDSRPQRSAMHELVGSPRAAVPEGGLGPVDLATAYDIAPLAEAGFLGDGQTVAIISFDTFTPGDVTHFDQQFGIDGPAPRKVSVGTALTAPGDGASEVALDIEVIRMVAPHAQILNFEGKNGTLSQADLIDAIVQDGRADIVSDSWGRCDDVSNFGPGSRERTLRSFQAAVAAGVSVFVASGDHGAYDCWADDPSDHREMVDFPSASPYTVSVGGTLLALRTDGSYLSESGWADYLATWGTGGGNNPTEARPSWQVGKGVDNEFSNGKRQAPDVSASGASDSPYQIFFTKPGASSGSWRHVYGTSAAAPFWAGITLLVRQLADREAVGRLGFVNPMLYALANSDQGGTIFHDVVRGSNLRHPATPGWDYATGLGSPDVTALAGAIVTYLRDHPAG